MSMRAVEKVGRRKLVGWKTSPDLVDICFLVPVLEPHPDFPALSEEHCGKCWRALWASLHTFLLLHCIHRAGLSVSCVGSVGEVGVLSCILGTDTVLGMQ